MGTVKSLAAFFALGAFPYAIHGVGANPTPSLVQIVRDLEQQQYDPVVDVDREATWWEIEALKKGTAIELHVDRQTGAITSEHRDDPAGSPPQGALRLSEVLVRLEKAGHGDIEEISFERRYWEVESLKHDGKHELYVDPLSGDIVSDRLDD
jgi:uncharacterized membrane protein YkoI